MISPIRRGLVPGAGVDVGASKVCGRGGSRCGSLREVEMIFHDGRHTDPKLGRWTGDRVTHP